ncbi:TetR/AcrR family transcriptional regulator [Rhodococcus sp. SGAir0479]|uniref:TetR/AcrR family transcriptional regulator n=1 Tax=Rhodococcus sp. SGAir0479 TaxID=2567884 RepID=UPI0020C7CE41|nr:TetR/AcrR family transcriptional regulator [Rhodococcus sp. SGAir0479]
MSNPGNAKTAMIEVAERMFAERGIDGVSMRDVAAAAGQRNNSAVQYHFGGRDGLVLEVFRRRMREINRSRAAFLARLDAEGRGHDVRGLVEAVVVPLADYLRTSGTDSYYAQFIARVSPSVDIVNSDLSDVTEVSREVSTRLMRALEHLPRRVAVIRVDLMLNMAVSALAVFEQRRNSGIPLVEADFDETVHHLVDMSVGALTVPDSASD